MNFIEIKKSFSEKLISIKKASSMNAKEMAGILGIKRESYERYEKSSFAPRMHTLYTLGKRFRVSLNWLILDEGPMFLSSEAEVKKNLVLSDTAQNVQMSSDIKELVESMEKNPLLRYEILAQFHRFKKEES